MSVDTTTEAAPSPSPQRPGWLVPLLVGVAVVVLAAAGVTTWALTRDSGKPPAALPTAAARSSSPECVAIDRAYTVWDSPLALPPNWSSVFELSDHEFEMLADHASDFADAVAGYPDQPAKTLAFKAATLPVEVGLARIQALGVGVEEDQARKVVGAIDDIRTAYLAWRTATCL